MIYDISKAIIFYDDGLPDFQEEDPSKPDPECNGM